MVLSVQVDRTGPPNIRLSLSNRPENVMLVRQMLAGVAEAVDLEAGDLNDISTAVTEACNNVVLHAYGGEEGPLEVELYASPTAIEVVVRDHGTGIRAPSTRTGETVGIGLSVIKTLAERADFSHAEDSGTEVFMVFGTPHARALPPFAVDEPELLTSEEAESDTAMEITIAPAPPGMDHSAPAAERPGGACALQDRPDGRHAARSPTLSPRRFRSRSGAVISASASASSRATSSCGSLRCGPGARSSSSSSPPSADLGPVLGTLTTDHRVAHGGILRR